ncbi:MAG: dual specificity protein phosphatase family protein [Deltaproteobacteria bacterium]
MKIFTELRRLYYHFRYQGFRKGILAAYDKLVRWRTGGPWMKFAVLSDKLWIGGQPRGRGIKSLVNNGVTAVINMRSEYDYAKKAHLHKLKYLQLPTDDNGAPEIRDIETGVNFITEELENGGRVYIHCWEGIGRSATMAAAYYVSLGKTPEEAWDGIRKVRPFIRPTASQMKRLEEYSQKF